MYLLRIFVLTDRAKDFCLIPKQAGAFPAVPPPPLQFFCSSTLIFDTITVKFVVF